jgi:hypothetical protein
MGRVADIKRANKLLISEWRSTPTCGATIKELRAVAAAGSLASS